MWSDNTYEARDGATLHVKSLIPDSPEGILLFVHGLGEHCGRYDELFSYFSGHGLGCLGFDLRGHGRSSGKRGHAPSYVHLLDDIGEMVRLVRQSYSHLPLFLYGHSMGGNLVLNYLARYETGDIRGAVVTSPWLKLKVKPSVVKSALAALMHRIYPAFSESNALDPSHLSRDPEVGRAYQSDPLVHDRISAGLFTSMVRSGRYILSHPSDVRVPVLLMHGLADPITSPDASRNLASSNPEYIEFREFPDMRHELHHEIGREEIHKTELEWLRRHV